jgi:predicted transcriptional regulator
MNRGRIEILHDILVALDGSRKKTHLMFRSNITHGMVERYLSILLTAQCVRKDDENYYITENGQKLRDSIDDILDMIKMEPEEEAKPWIVRERARQRAASLVNSTLR